MGISEWFGWAAWLYLDNVSVYHRVMTCEPSLWASVSKLDHHPLMHLWHLFHHTYTILYIFFDWERGAIVPWKPVTITTYFSMTCRYNQQIPFNPMPYRWSHWSRFTAYVVMHSSVNRMSCLFSAGHFLQSRNTPFCENHQKESRSSLSWRWSCRKWWVHA